MTSGRLSGQIGQRSEMGRNGGIIIINFVLFITLYTFLFTVKLLNYNNPALGLTLIS